MHAGAGKTTGEPGRETTPALALAGFTGSLEQLLVLARARQIDLGRIPVGALVDQLVDALQQAGQTPLGQQADWVVTEAQIGLDGVGSSFVLRGPDGTRHEAASPLPGLVNVSNAALAIALAHAAGVDVDVAIDAIAHAHEIPGRMERVVERGDGLPLCLVDYAHTPDALVLALEAVRPITPGRLVIVFGSDGDRDRGKRPIMGEIAARLADVLVVMRLAGRRLRRAVALGDQAAAQADDDPAARPPHPLPGVAAHGADESSQHQGAPRSASRSW